MDDPKDPEYNISLWLVYRELTQQPTVYRSRYSVTRVPYDEGEEFDSDNNAAGL